MPLADDGAATMSALGLVYEPRLPEVALIDDLGFRQRALGVLKSDCAKYSTETDRDHVLLHSDTPNSQSLRPVASAGCYPSVAPP